ncbi:MAG: hypothetical protein ABSB79_00985 [Syntrophales bacterium]|jgi:hypothetical protein
MKKVTILTLGIMAVLLPMLLPTSAYCADKSCVVKIGSDVVIDRTMTVKHVVAIGGQVTVEGTVEGDIVAIGGSIVLTGEAVVYGNAVSVGGVIFQGRNTDIRGNITEINASNFWNVISSAFENEEEGWSWILAVVSLATFFCLLIIALLVSFLLPRPIVVIVATVEEETLRSLLWGVLGLILVVPLALLLTISVIGIVLIPLEVILVTVGVVMGFISISQLIGKGLYSIFKRKEPGIVRETFWGLVILWFLGWIPYFGITLKVLAIVLGLGGVILSRFGTRMKGLHIPDLPHSHIST